MFKFFIILAISILLPILADVFDSKDLSIISLMAYFILIIAAMIRLFKEDVVQSEPMRFGVLVLCIFSGAVIIAFSDIFPRIALFRIPRSIVTFLGVDGNIKSLVMCFSLAIINLILWNTIRLFWKGLSWSTICYACLISAFLSIPPSALIYFWIRSIMG